MLIEIALISLTIFVLWLIIKMPPNTPPGHWGLPLFGYIPLFERDHIKILTDMRQQYGEVVSWRIGTRHMVFVFDFKLIKEALTGEDFVDRPMYKSFSIMDPGDKELGIVFANGRHWQNLRRFSLRHLRDLGMGKSRLVEAVQYEADELVSELQKQTGIAAVLPESMTISILNIIWQMVASTRYALDDKEILEFAELIALLQNNLARSLISDIFPWITKIIPAFLMNKLLRNEVRICLSKKMNDFLMRFIEEHKKNLDVTDPKDFIDAYLIEMENQKDDPLSSMSIEDLLFCIGDLFTAGSETTTKTLQWAIYYLAAFPEAQKKLQKEIDDVMPKGISASFEYRARLPYTEAFIHELLRHANVIPIGVFHTGPTDAHIGGYRIPKGAVVFGTSFTCHNEAKYFDSPKEFRPERFLDEEGKFVAPKEGFLPFGIGRRQCLGESLARMEAFVFLTTLVQNLSFGPPPGETVDLTAEKSNPLFSIPNQTQKILLENRE